MNIRVLTKISFSELTTFKIGGPADFFTEVKNIDELKEALSFAREKSLPILMLGGGSNILVSDTGFRGLVIKTNFRGFEIDSEKVKIAGGENWDECVKRCVEAGLWGVENLSFIPGHAAGLAIQNVGAYGQQASDVIDLVEVYDTMTNDELRMTNEACKFGYRKSIFNSTERGKYVVLGLTLKLSKNGAPNTSYGLKPATLQEMREQVIAIRKSKGQDPKEYHSAGSFFKNPIITETELKKLQNKLNINIPHFPETPFALPLQLKGESERVFKIPAGYLLDKICNLKGLSVEGAKMSELQVINIINTGNATAQNVLDLFKKAQSICLEKTGILLENEPELVGF